MRSYLLVLLLLTACTTPIVRDTTSIDDNTAKCENVDCVIAEMDKLPQGLDKDRYPFMEGLSDAKLGKMKAEGRLTVEIMNPLLIPLGFYGYSLLWPKHYGGMAKCDVRYIPGLNWLSLKHELSHCQGYVDHGIPIMSADYTEDQKYILERDGVSKWVDTNYYKTRKYQASVTKEEM